MEGHDTSYCHLIDKDARMIFNGHIKDARKARKEAREIAKASLGKNAGNADLILDEAIELITDKMVLDKK